MKVRSFCLILLCIFPFVSQATVLSPLFELEPLETENHLDSRFDEARKEVELFSAIEKQQIRKVIKLLNQGTNIEARNKEGMTPLLLAAQFGFSGIVNELLRHGACLYCKRPGILPLTPRQVAAASLKVECAGLLYKAEKVFEFAMNGFDFDEPQTLQWVTEYNVHAKNEIGQTPLDIAFLRQDVEGLRLLFEVGAIVDVFHKFK